MDDKKIELVKRLNQFVDATKDAERSVELLCMEKCDHFTLNVLGPEGHRFIAKFVCDRDTVIQFATAAEVALEMRCEELHKELIETA